MTVALPEEESQLVTLSRHCYLSIFVAGPISI